MQSHPNAHAPHAAHLGSLANGMRRIWWIALLIACATVVQAQVVPTDSFPAPGKGTIKGSVPETDTTIKIITGGLPDAVGDTVKAVATAEDSIKAKKKFRLQLSPKKDFYDPKVAVRRSLVLPGWGQVYNNRIWKVPIIYGGFAAFTAFFIGNHQGYLEYDLSLIHI